MLRGEFLRLILNLPPVDMHRRDRTRCEMLESSSPIVACQRILMQVHLKFEPMLFDESEPFTDYGGAISRRTHELFRPKRIN